MILVNLLPHREAARKRRQQMFNVVLGMAGVAGLALAGLVYAYYQILISQQEGVNTFIKAENSALDVKIKDIQNLESEIAALHERQQAVEGLQQQRNDPVQLFNELAAKLPDGAYLTSIKQTKDTVAIDGVAQSNERVSEFLRNLRDSTLLAKSPQLEETTVQDVTLPNNKGKSKAYGFKMTLTLKQPETKDAPAGKPRAPASANKG